jgi:hypothetical protein
MVENPERRQAWAERGSEFVHTYHDEAKVVATLKSIYREVLNR